MNFDEIKELMKLFSKSKITKLKIKELEFEIELKKESKKSQTVHTQVVEPQAIQASAPAQTPAQTPVATPPQEESEPQKSGELITSPMVGTFYAAPSPDSPPFVSAGDTARKGQTLCILEAMKIMNELEAEFDCKILEVLVQDGQPVEYDTPLFRVERL